MSSIVRYCITGDNMTKARELWIGARVQFWRSFPYGNGFLKTTSLKRENKRIVPGTVICLDPLRVCWDFTANNGPPMDYPLGGDGYDRSCIKLLPGQ